MSVAHLACFSAAIVGISSEFSSAMVVLSSEFSSAIVGMGSELNSHDLFQLIWGKHWSLKGILQRDSFS